jgi:hypothetical protein
MHLANVYEGFGPSRVDIKRGVLPKPEENLPTNYD